MDGAILASSVQEDLGLAGAVLPPCINLRRFGRVTAPLESFEGEAVNILFLGRLEPRKGVSVLLKAYGLLRRGGQAARLLIAGEGPDRQRLERLAATEGIPDVVFLGRIEDVDLPSLYATCDIFCAPSTDGEGFGIVLVEAMASGKPVVAAANAGYRSVLHGEAASLLARPSDVRISRASWRCSSNSQRYVRGWANGDGAKPCDTTAMSSRLLLFLSTKMQCGRAKADRCAEPIRASNMNKRST